MHISIPITKQETQHLGDVAQFYDEATKDYEFWSQDFNMHFGYYIPFKTNLLKRDSMLNEMNNQVFKRLNFDPKGSLIADLGCGVGATMNYGLMKFPYTYIIGVTLSKYQVTEGNQRLKNKNGLILEEDYAHTSFASNSVSSAYAIESFCHSGHSNQPINEAYRILKQKGRLVIADAFLKKNKEELCLGSKYCHDQFCNGWKLKEIRNIHQVKQTLEKTGFHKIKIEEISHAVAPSILHVPFSIPSFILKKIMNKEKITSQSWNNLKASFFALLSGLHIHSFGYYLITAEK